MNRPVSTESALSDESSLSLWRKSVNTLPGVGPAVAKKLVQLKINTLADIWLHFPFRYQDRTRITPIRLMLPGMEALIVAKVLDVKVIFARRRTLVVRIYDRTAELKLRFFYFSKAQQQKFLLAHQNGEYIQCFGDVNSVRNSLEMVHPEYTLLTSLDAHRLETRYTPVYPVTAGITQTMMRKLCGNAMQLLCDKSYEELLPPSLIEQFNLPDPVWALHKIHNPSPDQSLLKLNEEGHPLKLRFALEELIAFQMSLRKLKFHYQRNFQASPVNKHSHNALQLQQKLPFKLTHSQQNSIKEILTDLAKTFPMQRLLQGDVGCGKTIVAVICALYVIDSGQQCAFMVPTDLLAAQHFQNLEKWFNELDVNVKLLTGRLQGKAHQQTRAQLASGEIDIVVGTHALFQSGVEFANLGFVIIDEQHRFGVQQRLALRDKGSKDNHLAHQLIMTATPIPRTLAMAMYADFDISIITEKPFGRQQIVTSVMSEKRRDEVIKRIQIWCNKGRQVYWVCALVDESEKLVAQAAEKTHANLQQEMPELSISLVHGKMAADKKQTTMREFQRGNIAVLVATTVIEVGVDVANASLIVIENAERFGLAQLHQLRGRVGRGNEQANCILLYKPPLSEIAQNRLNAVRSTQNGFELAKHDLKLRGAGELLGTRQSGAHGYKVAKLGEHHQYLPDIQKTADELIKSNTDKVQKLIDRWVGEAEQYKDV